METKEDFLKYEMRKYLMDHTYRDLFNLTEEVAKEDLVGKKCREKRERVCHSYPFCRGCSGLVEENENN